ncbi:MAG: hypothetical protein WAW86_07235 [Gammaproteobacteria bacterium]
MSISPQKQALDEFNKKKQQELKDFNDVNLLIIREEIRITQIIAHILDLIGLKNREEKNEDLMQLLALESNQSINNLDSKMRETTAIKNGGLIEDSTVKGMLKEFIESLQSKLTSSWKALESYKKNSDELMQNLQEVRRDIVDHGLKLVQGIPLDNGLVPIKFNVPENDNNFQNGILTIDKNITMKLIQSFLSDIHKVSLYDIEGYFKEKAKDFILDQLSKKFNLSEPLDSKQQDFLNKIVMQDSIQNKINKLASGAFGHLMNDRTMIEKIALGATIQSDFDVVGIRKHVEEDKFLEFVKAKSYGEKFVEKIGSINISDSSAILDSLIGAVANAEEKSKNAEKTIEAVVNKREDFLSRLQNLKGSKSSVKSDISAISDEVDESLLMHMVDAVTSKKPQNIAPINDEDSSPKPNGFRR